MAKCELEKGSYFQVHYPRGLPSRRNYDLFLDFLNLQPGERVLDVGSGSGMLAAAISSRGVDVVGVDISPVAVREAQKRYPTVRFVLMDAMQLDQEFAPASFDAITCVQVLEHILPAKVIHFTAQLAWCLRDRGRLLIDIPVTDNLSDKWLVFRNQYLSGQHRPAKAIDSSFNPTHLWKIGDVNLLLEQFKTHSLEAERVCRLYYVPWALERLNCGALISYLPNRWLQQFLKGATILLRKGTVTETSEIVQFSAFWSDPPGASGLARLKKLLA